MGDWAPFLWTLLWIVVGLIVLGLLVWGFCAYLAVRSFNRISRGVESQFDTFTIGRPPTRTSPKGPNYRARQQGLTVAERLAEQRRNRPPFR